VSVCGAVPITLPAPLPGSVVLALGEKGWGFEASPEPPPFRLHTPGSAMLLYEGEPLLIVYGTRGSEAERGAMRSAALAASKSPTPSWPDDKGEAGTDKVPHNQNLYGWLNTKADADVTDADIAKCHLVLIGTAAQNAVVSRIAELLPVHFSGGAVTCSDGARFEGGKLALGLVHFNPLAPKRLIFWVAAGDPSAYAANSAIPSTMGGGDFHAGEAFSADLVVMRASSSTLVAARSFDSRWRWVPGRDASPLVAARLAQPGDFEQAVGEAIRRAAAADFALIGATAPAAPPPVSIGVTRISDVVPLYANIPIGMAEVSGTELLDMARLASAKDSGLQIPSFDAGRIEAGRTYRVAMPVNILWTFSGAIQPAPRNYRLTGLDSGDAVARFLPAD
jgi:hypothetical protein